MPVREHEATSLARLVEVVTGLTDTSPSAGFWYRGLPCHTYECVPKLLRDGRPMEQVLEREKRLLTRFRQRSMAYWPSGYPQTDWEHLFAMQHYGIPTRLLDWSENLLVAAYFALWESPTGHDHDPCLPRIWVLDPVQWNRTTPRLSEFGDSVGVMTTVDDLMESYRPEGRTLINRPRSPVAIYGAHNSKRIVSQRGTFVVWGSDMRSLEAAAAESEAVLHLVQLVAPVAQLRHELSLIGFTETMVFPELPSLATELGRQESWR